MNILWGFRRFTNLISRKILIPTTLRDLNNFIASHPSRTMSTLSEKPELKDFMDFIDKLENFEKCGVPKDAGTDSEDGFDLGRMRRLMQLLGNPQCKFKAFHIAGTKGKGSTAAFLSSILRAEGYSVGCYTSPHIRTIRERITLGISGEPVSAKTLSDHFQNLRAVLDRAVELENRHLSHFEVLTAVAFSLFAKENVDIAVIEAGLGGARDATNVISSSTLAASIITTIGEEHLAALGGSLESIAMAKSGIIKDGRPLVLGGPFLPHIERILRDKALSMSSPVVSASDIGNRSTLKSLHEMHAKPHQVCDIVLQIELDLQLFIEVFDVTLSILGSHQLKNAATATCAALCLRDQGWRLSNNSIRAGLQNAFLLGRSHFLTPQEAETLGLPGATIMLDGAHTKDSARALASTIEMALPQTRIVLVVAMAIDKDHLGFARELLTVKNLEAVLLTEVDIAGDKIRTTLASSLRESWIHACREMGIRFIDCRADEHEVLKDKNLHSDERSILFSERSLRDSMKAANQILTSKTGGLNGAIVVTGSLHIVSAILGLLEG